MPQPRVSAVIIFLNEERFIEEAIESVFAQTFREWELLLVDDGSSDRSGRIARDYAQRHIGRVLYMTHEGGRNLGMSASRNLALRHARGEFVGFLDADDVWEPEKLEQQVRILQIERDAAMIYGRTLIWLDWTKGSGCGSRDFYYDLGLATERLHPPPTPFLVMMENRSQTPTTCNALMRRSVVDALGGFESTFRGMFEDQVLFAKIMLEKSVYVSGNTWAKYRQHRTSASARIGSTTVHWARVAYLNWLASYMRAKSLSDPVCRRAVARARRSEVRELARLWIRRIKRAFTR